ncbi:MAG: hypothetical protein KAU02_04325, partial [Tenericutes bacterium]|nr:hypothetical protein [Mycoplasmatota bacterium]
HGAIAADGTYTVAGEVFNTVDIYQTTYNTEITNSLLNYLTNTWTYNSEHYTNMVDGLVENDQYSNIVGAMAIGYKTVINDDLTQTWTFQLREDVPWVDNATGEVYGVVTAADFVSGIKYVLDPINGSGTASIVYNLLEGAEAYYESLSDDAIDDLAFSTVGIEAVSQYEVAYTVKQATPYFLSALTYSPFLPVSSYYLEQIGTDFGASEDFILVNGAFRMTEHIRENLITYTKNELYWDAEHVYVDTVTKRFVPGTSTASTLREWYEAGNIDGFTVSTQDEVGYENYVTGADLTGTVMEPVDGSTNPVLRAAGATYIGYFNFARDVVGAEYNGGLSKTVEEHAATLEALLNVDFRLGFLHGLKVMDMLKWWHEDEPELWLMRGYTIRELCAFEGKDYANYVDDVYNEKEGTSGITLTGILQGDDPVYDAVKSEAYFATAKAELIAGGLTEADFPIKIDVIGNMNVARQAYNLAMFDALEAASAGVVEIQYNIPATDDQDATWGSITMNYDFSIWSGWGPDYADPQTFLHTMVVGGDMVDSLGFDGTNEALEIEVLGGYTALYDIGAALTDIEDLEARYMAFAEAEYALTYEYAIVIPWLGTNGYSPVVSKAIPNRAGKASYGLTEDKLKNVIVTDAAITQAQRTAVLDDYEANK